MDFRALKEYLSKKNCERLKRVVAAVLRRRKIPEPLVEEAFQTAMLRMLEVSKEGGEITDIPPYAARVAVNTAIDEVLMQSRRGEHVELDKTLERYLSDPAEPVVEAIYRQNRQLWVEKEIAALEPELQAILTYVYSEGHSYAEAALHFNKSKATIHRRLARSLAALRLKADAWAQEKQGR